MKWLSTLPLALLIGCAPSAATKAEKAHEIASGAIDRCAMARNAERAWLENGNDEKYREWRSKASMDCLRASLPGAR